MLIMNGSQVITNADHVHVGWNLGDRTVVLTGSQDGEVFTRIMFGREEMEILITGIAMALFELDSPFIAASITATLTPQGGEDHGSGPLCEDAACPAAGEPHGHHCPSCGHGTYHPAPEGKPTL